MPERKQRNYRLEHKILDLIDELAECLVCSQSDVIRRAVLLLARRELGPRKNPREEKKSP